MVAVAMKRTPVAVQQPLVAARTGADNQGIGIIVRQNLAVYIAGRQVYHVGRSLQHTPYKRYMAVNYYCRAHSLQFFAVQKIIYIHPLNSVFIHMTFNQILGDDNLAKRIVNL